MDIKRIILKWYNRHSNFLDATLDIASDLVPGGKIITNLLKATKAIYDDDRNSINQQISQDQMFEITNFLQNIQPVILNLMEEVEELKDFKDSISIKERKKILKEGSFKEQLQKVIPKIVSSLTETVNKTKSSKNLTEINKAISEDKSKQMNDTNKEVDQISIELPKIAGWFYKIIGDKKTKITAGNIVLNSKEYLGVESKSSNGFEKIMSLSDLILDKIKYFKFYKYVNDEEIKKLSSIKNLQELNLHWCNKISDNGIKKLQEQLKFLKIIR